MSLQKQYYTALQRAMVIGSVILAGASALAVSFLNRKLQPAVNLTEILKRVVLPEDEKQIKMSWELIVLWKPYLTQCLIAYRLFINIVLAFFSPDKHSYALSAFMQTITLWNEPSRDLIIYLERVYSYPVKFIRTMTASFRIRLPLHSLTGCSSLSSHIESQIKSIYDYTTHFLEGASWREYFLTKDGVYEGRVFDAILQSSPLAACSCKLTAIFEWMRGSAVHIYHGAVKIYFIDKATKR